MLNQLRVIAGSAKGHKLSSLKGLKTRPTLERVREAVFNILGTVVCDAIFLDLFAGTGAMGIEALSRGAKFVYFNDYDRIAKTIIKQNLLNCHLDNKSEIYNMDAELLIKLLDKQLDKIIDIIYIDPPYEIGKYDSILVLIEKSSLLKDGSLVIAETNNRTSLMETIGRLKLKKKSSYGDTIIWFYKYNCNLEE
jgi:16S rRNA (guanine(966)-N(2))-methyltransferase RsmD